MQICTCVCVYIYAYTCVCVFLRKYILIHKFSLIMSMDSPTLSELVHAFGNSTFRQVNEDDDLLCGFDNITKWIFVEKLIFQNENMGHEAEVYKTHLKLS